MLVDDNAIDNMIHTKVIEKSGIAEEQIIKSINNLKSSSNTINKYIDEISNKIFKKRKREYLIKYKDFLTLTNEVQIKILGKLIKNLSGKDYPPRSKKINNALKFININHKKRYLFGGCLIINDGRTVFIKKIT